MTKPKSERYCDLVAKFKKHKFNDPRLINPHAIEGFDYNVINPWELWHNDLNAKVLFIGQDFSDTTSLQNHLKTDWAKEKTSATNNHLIDFFSILGYHFDDVDYTYPKKHKHKLFFTNAILGIKVTAKESMGLPVKDSWWRETAAEYLKEIIDIIQPKHIIVMSMVAYKAICYIYNITPEKTVFDAIANNGRRNIPNGVNLFVVNHCSPNGCIKRPIQTQGGDWIKIRNYMEGEVDEESSSIKTIS